VRTPPRAIVKPATALARALYRLSGGKLGGLPGTDVLLLTTTGRRSGKPRTTPLIYLSDGRSLVVVASFGGSDAHPAWYLNLEANPEVEVRIGREATRRMRARPASAAERERLWPEFTKIYGGYEKYRQRTEREIPLVFLEPLARPSQAGE
jgi:deazaflavin-dependent oxidoreductase (nitroreductase family)